MHFFSCFLQFNLVIASPTPVLLHFNLKKYHSYFAFSFLTTIHVFYCLFWDFQTLNRNTIPSLFLDTVKLKVKLLSSHHHVNTSDYLQYLVCCLLVCNYVLSTVFWHSNLKMHQPWLSSRSLHCKYTKHIIFSLFLTARNV